MKRTIFEGIVNGEKFDNIQAYNNRVNELLEEGTFESASSNTRVEEYVTSGYSQPENSVQEGECTCTCSDICEDEISFYPYMEKDDPYYLDLLVTKDPITNSEAIDEVNNVFTESWNAINAALDDSETTNEARKEYLSDLNEIIGSIKQDKLKNNEAYKILSNKQQEITTELNAYVEKVNEEIKFIEQQKQMLRDAEVVIDLFNAFYSDVTNHVITSITENENMPCSCTKHANHNDCNENCECNKSCDGGKSCCDEKIVTSCKESEPQIEIKNLSDVMNAIFDSVGNFRHLF